MLKFTMNSKELKKMIDKGVAAINKKLKTPALTRLYFQVDANGIVKILGTDYDHYAEIRNDSAWDTSPGVLGIDVDDLNIITKMNGNITLEDISTEKENKISVKVGNKCITIPRYENVDIFLPSIDETEKCILSVKESWLLDTIVSLFTHTSDNESNKMMQVFSDQAQQLQNNMDRIRQVMESVNHSVEESALGVSRISEMSASINDNIRDIEGLADSNMDIANMLDMEVNKFRLQ